MILNKDIIKFIKNNEIPLEKNPLEEIAEQ